MINLFYDCYTILNKVYSDKAYIKQAITNTQIEEKNRASIVKICYGVLDKDIELSYYITYLAPKSPKLAIRTILKISMYCIKYLEKKDYAVIQNAVELTKKLGKGGAGGFVNATLRKFAKTEIPLPKDNLKRLMVELSYPEFLLKEILKTFDEKRIKNIIEAVPKTTLAFYETDGEKYLKEHNIEYNKTPYDNVFTVEKFARNSDYDSGVYTYQSIGSVAICDAVAPCKNLLDCCAAPGGKSVRLSYKCENVLSWDIHEHRVELIKSYANRMNRKNIKAECHDAKIFNPELEKCFDAVLCDVPCSGTGVISENPDIKLNRSEEDLASINTDQLAILDTASKYVKNGGYLYYSTCSILRRENSDIIEMFLTTHTDFEIENTDSKLPFEWFGYGNTFLPDISSGVGFYIAILKRK